MSNDIDSDVELIDDLNEDDTSDSSVDTDIDDNETSEVDDNETLKKNNKTNWKKMAESNKNYKKRIKELEEELKSSKNNNT